MEWEPLQRGPLRGVSLPHDPPIVVLEHLTIYSRGSVGPGSICGVVGSHGGWAWGRVGVSGGRPWAGGWACVPVSHHPPGIREFSCTRPCRTPFVLVPLVVHAHSAMWGVAGSMRHQHRTRGGANGRRPTAAWSCLFFFFAPTHFLFEMGGGCVTRGQPQLGAAFGPVCFPRGALFPRPIAPCRASIQCTVVAGPVCGRGTPVLGPPLEGGRWQCMVSWCFFFLAPYPLPQASLVVDTRHVGAPDGDLEDDPGSSADGGRLGATNGATSARKRDRFDYLCAVCEGEGDLLRCDGQVREKTSEALVGGKGKP